MQVVYLVQADFFDGLIIGLLQLFIGFAFSVSALYIGISLLDRLTKGLDGWKQIQKGNVAAGVLYAAAVFALVWMIEPSIISTVLSINLSSANVMFMFAANILVLIISLLVAVLSIYILLRIIDTMTVDVSEIKEISRGNVAVALVTSSALLAVCFVIRTAIEFLVAALTLA